MAIILKNPFYMGIIRIRATGETFIGIHEPLVSASLFERVQDVLAGKRVGKVQKHHFLFRRLFQCGHCGSYLTGERQKGRVYYRCHKTACSGTSVSESAIEREVIRTLDGCAVKPSDMPTIRKAVQNVFGNARRDVEAAATAGVLKVKHLEAREERLTDALLDGLIDRDAYNTRRRALLVDRQRLSEALAARADPAWRRQAVLDLFERAEMAPQLYRNAEGDEKRELLSELTSNRSVTGKNIVVEPNFPFFRTQSAAKCTQSGVSRSDVRTLTELVQQAWDHFETRPAELIGALPKKKVAQRPLGMSPDIPKVQRR
jgi:hypothetical protein